MKMCPLISTGQTTEYKCYAKDCAWWNEENFRCAVLMISHSVEYIRMTGLEVLNERKDNAKGDEVK